MGNLVIVGSRKAGKTTYLAGLAYWSSLVTLLREKNQKTSNKLEVMVQPVGDEATWLAEQAKNIVIQKGFLEGTPNNIAASEIPHYFFSINIKNNQQKEQVNVTFRDSSGELLDHLATGKTTLNDEEVLEDFLMKDVVGCMIMLGGWEDKDDEIYRASLEGFLNLIREHEREQDLRIAVVMSKCERGELWPGRIEPEIDIFEAHLPRTKEILTASISPQYLRFFALSTFGVLDLNRKDYRPNRKDELPIKLPDGQIIIPSVLREEKKWRPYNLIAPLYWLSTGKRMEENV